MNTKDTQNTETVAELLYSTWCEIVGRMARDGSPLPLWQDLKEQKCDAWRGIARHTIALVALFRPKPAMYLQDKQDIIAPLDICSRIRTAQVGTQNGLHSNLNS